MVEPEAEEGDGLEHLSDFGAGGKSEYQKGLLQLAVAIAGSRLQPAVVHPLSLVELDEEYAFNSTPTEADRLIQVRRARLEEVKAWNLQKSVRWCIRCITNNIARATAEIARTRLSDLILVGWHRPAFNKNRLGGRVGQILTRRVAV